MFGRRIAVNVANKNKKNSLRAAGHSATSYGHACAQNTTLRQRGYAARRLFRVMMRRSCFTLCRRLRYFERSTLRATYAVYADITPRFRFFAI